MASKRFGVNITRTITMDQTVYVKARNDTEAMRKVQAAADDGKAGDPFVEFRKAKGIFADDVEGGEINEEIQVEDAYEEED